MYFVTNAVFFFGIGGIWPFCMSEVALATVANLEDCDANQSLPNEPANHNIPLTGYDDLKKTKSFGAVLSELRKKIANKAKKEYHSHDASNKLILCLLCQYHENSSRSLKGSL